MSKLINYENTYAKASSTDPNYRLEDSSATSITKDRSVSRKRHHSEKKEEKKQHESIMVLEAKLKRLPSNANNTDLNRLAKRVDAYYKKSPKLKNSLKEKRA